MAVYQLKAPAGKILQDCIKRHLSYRSEVPTSMGFGLATFGSLVKGPDPDESKAASWMIKMRREGGLRLGQANFKGTAI